MIGIVISKYNENVNWINKIDKKLCKIYLYDKYTDVNNFDNIYFKKLPNVGRESHTYLTYIIENYYNLDDLIIFTQGKWDDHVSNIFELYKIPNEKSFHYGDYPSNFKLEYWKGKMEREKDNLNFDQWIRKYIEVNIDKYINNHKGKGGAIFCIKKENILSRPLEFYKNLIKQLNHINPEVGHFFERAWYYIFNIHKDNIIKNPDFIVVGSGLSGVVLAEQLSEKTNKKVLIIEKRDHIGGNCYDYFDEETNIIISKYGAHLFHTNSDNVWDFVNKYSEWFEYKHKVYGKIDDKIFPVPINIKTVNLLCNLNIKNEEEMKEYLESVRDKTIIEPKNSEEYCLNKFGNDIYEKVIKYYTKKQWDKYPNELDVSVLKRIPIRYDFTEGYFNDKYQALPKYGYTNFINNIVNKTNICILYNTDFFEYKNKIDLKSIEKIFYTGPIDQYYSNLGLPKLEYRSINFVFEKINNIDYFQENSVINYPSYNEDFTRIVEYKHFYKNINLLQSNHSTIISKEYTTDNGDPYYPVPNKKNQELYNKYKEYAEKEDKIIFVGRLASYKYYNMDEAILASLNIIDNMKFDFIYKTFNYKYIDTSSKLHNFKKIKIHFKTKSDAHIGLFYNNEIINEIVIGGWNNSKSAVRNHYQGNNIYEKEHNYCDNFTYKYLIFEKKNNIINIYDNKNIILFTFECMNIDNFDIKISSWNDIHSYWFFSSI
jgi:UDP-galactopyranose mutase